MGIGEWYSIGCAFAWAVAVILIKKSGESLAPVPLNLFKNVLALGLFLITILVLEGRALPPIPADALFVILLSGFLGIGLGDTLYFRALNTIGASRMGVAQTAYSPSVILLSVLFLGERLAAIQLFGVGLVVAGILLVTYMPALQNLDAARMRRGVGLAALSVFVMAAGIVLAKPMLETYAFLWVVLLRIVGGLLGLGAFVLWRVPGRELLAAYRGVRHWPAVVGGTVIGSYVAMMLWLAGYKYTEASIAAILNELAAVFILVLSVLLLRERVTRRQLVGTALALVGVGLVVMV